LLTKIIQAFRQKSNLQILAIVFFLFILIDTVAWFTIRPYAKKSPCAICGRINTKPVKTLYQYRFEVVPYVKEIQVWYCEKHVRTAPEIVTKLPATKDTVASRFRISVITGLITLVSLLFIIILLEMNFYWLFLHAGLISTTFIIFGVTSNITMTIFLLSTVAVAVLIFYFWYRRYNRV